MISRVPVPVGLGKVLCRVFAVDQDFRAMHVSSANQTSSELQAIVPKMTICAPMVQIFHMPLRGSKAALASPADADSCRNRTAANMHSE